MIELLPAALHHVRQLTPSELVIGAGTLALGAAALASFITVLLRDAHRRRSPAPPPEDDPRWKGESRPQRVGRACSSCGRVVRLEPDAATCEACGEVCHVGCVARHAARQHAPAVGPFR